MPGLTGDIASARWLAKIATIRSAAVTPDSGDKSSELTELFVMDVIPLNSDATNNTWRRRFPRVSFCLSKFSLAKFSRDGVLDLKIEIAT
jgi:hypothetical protein